LWLSWFGALYAMVLLSMNTCALSLYSTAAAPTTLRLTVLLMRERTYWARIAEPGPRLSRTVLLSRYTDEARMADA